jgi:hypothetical protein
MRWLELYITWLLYVYKYTEYFAYKWEYVVQYSRIIFLIMGR